MKKTINLLTLASLPLLFLLAACGPTPPASVQIDDDDADGTAPTASVQIDDDADGTAPIGETNSAEGIESNSWQLDSYTVDGKMGKMVEALPETTFTFANGQMAGMTGCNNTGAEYTIDDNNISFGTGMSTMMFCGEVENGQEDAIQANLNVVATYKVDGGNMQMMNADGNVILQFSAIEIDQPSTAEIDQPSIAETEDVNNGAALFEDKMWQLDSYNANGELMATTASGTYTFTSAEDENPAQMDAHTGCNNISATYTLDGQKITFGMGISTQKSCGEALDMQEAGIQSSLHSTTSYEIEGGTLKMTNASGTIMMQFSAIENVTLTDTLWQATKMNNGTDGVISLLPETTVTAVFAADNTLSGNASCNMYNTSYQVNGDELQVDPSIVTTRRACAEPIATQEGMYLTALSSAVTYKILGNKLELHDANGSLQISYTAVPATSLTSTTWEAIAYGSGGQVAVSVINGTRITAVFDENGKISGSAGCNSYFSSYEADSSAINIGEETAKTAMDCPADGVMAQEAAYVAALSTAATYTISDNKLELRTADGALAVSYIAAEPVSLAESGWDILAYNNGKGGVASNISGIKITMNFDAGGGVSGSAGCNSYFGSYEAGQELIVFGLIGSTEMFCAEPEGVMEQEAEFLAALATVNSYHIDGDLMTMRDENGGVAVQLKVTGDS